ncbi:hypothetical protein [Burkholderia anthina]|uniref:hypothetical protein n=1 Tax=Burkholderia anthina TaxID=179879 RepID=UPI00158A58AD|nr:hypothetical protein [Burkholderia anthina]
MQTTLIDELVNFKEGYARASIAIGRASNGGEDERGGGAAHGVVPATACREQLMESGGETTGETGAHSRHGARPERRH